MRADGVAGYMRRFRRSPATARQGSSCASGQAAASRGRVTVDCGLPSRIAYPAEDGRVAHLRSRPAMVLTWDGRE